MNRAAVLGSPVAHSLSPLLHAAGYAALGLRDWSYGRHEVDEGGLAPFVRGLDETWRGLSLTMPLKEVAFEVADRVSDLAREAGAINTLVRTEAGWSGDNTDVHGLVAALRDAGVVRPGTATIIGSGATARSALLALRELGVTSVRVAARNPTTAHELCRHLPGAAHHVPLARWSQDPGEAVVSTVPGAGGAAAAEVVEDDLSGVVLLDVVYADWPTPLARAATTAGATVVSGLEMLVHQAARQLELFTGATAPVAAMQSAGRAALGRPGPGSVDAMSETPDHSDVETRAALLPEERAAGSDDSQEQAEIILEESIERTEEPERTRHESTQTPE